jgi:hypothetical protein
LASLNVFNSALMNDAVYKFKRYEDASLEYAGISRWDGEATGLFDTVVKQLKVTRFDSEKLLGRETIEVHQLDIDRKRPSRMPCAASKTRKAYEYVQAAFDSLLATDTELSEFVALMQKKRLQTVVFGGWARDRLAEYLLGKKYASRDIDFVSQGETPIADLFPLSAERNPFGGVGFNFPSIHVDAWNLSETFLIQRNRISVNFSSLPETADYNINAIIFKPRQFFKYPNILDCGAGDALLKRELDFMADEVAQPRIQVVRLVIFSTRFNLHITDTLNKFVADTCEKNIDIEVIRDGIEKYSPTEYVHQALILFKRLIKG